jgi:hypothetical protein
VEATPFGRYQLIELMGRAGMVQTESHRAVCATPTPQDPIATLTGHGHWEQSEPCAVSVEFDETFTRTGD